MLSFCLHLVLRPWPTAFLGRLFGRAPDVIPASLPSFQLRLPVFGSPPDWHSFVLEVRDLWPQVLIDQGEKPKQPNGASTAWMERQVYRHASAVVVLAKGAEPFVRERGARRTVWLPNGPDLTLFTPRSLFDVRSVFTVLYAGAHGDANALDNVIAAARLLEQSQVSFRIRFVGDGPEKQSLMRLAEDLKSVSFEAPVPKSQIPDLMAEADAILLSLKDVPLFHYGVSPNKLYDAYALGRPVITTVAGAINAEVAHYRLGETAPPGDPEALAAAIKRLIDTPKSERKAMANRAIALAHSIYSRQRINAEYNALLRGVIAA